MSRWYFSTTPLVMLLVDDCRCMGFPLSSFRLMMSSCTSIVGGKRSTCPEWRNFMGSFSLMFSAASRASATSIGDWKPSVAGMMIRGTSPDWCLEVGVSFGCSGAVAC